MTTIETINYKYLGITIVFLMLTYYFLHTTNKSAYKNTINNKQYIKVITSKGEFNMDSNIFEMHMTRMKDNITRIYKDFNTNDCPKIKTYLDKARISTKKYIEMNIQDTSMSFCDFNSQYNIFDDYVMQERELLKHKLVKKTEKDDDEDEDIADKTRYKLLELIVDMDIILFLMRSSLCKNGYLNLSYFDQVILELYRSKCSTEKFTPSSENMNLADPVDEFDMIDYNAIKPRALVGKGDTSQDMTDTDTFIKAGLKKENLFKKQAESKSDVSHARNDSFKCNEARLGKRLERNNTNVLEWGSGWHDSGASIDKQSKTSLM